MAVGISRHTLALLWRRISRALTRADRVPRRVTKALTGDAAARLPHYIENRIGPTEESNRQTGDELKERVEIVAVEPGLSDDVREVAEQNAIAADDCAELAMRIGVAYLRTSRMYRARWVHGVDIDATIASCRQAVAENELVRRFVTARALPYLNYGISDYFDDNVTLQAAGLALEREAGIYLIGQIVTLSRSQLARHTCMSDAVLDEFERNLAMVGLGLNMYAPRWRNPGNLPVSAARRS